jgi:hypothetical protein
VRGRREREVRGGGGGSADGVNDGRGRDRGGKGGRERGIWGLAPFWLRLEWFCRIVKLKEREKGEEARNRKKKGKERKARSKVIKDTILDRSFPQNVQSALP